MMHKFYISGVLLPIPPSSLEISINDKDEEIDLANGGTMSVLNQHGLTTYSFSFRVPNIRYPFALYESGYIEAPAFLSLLERLKLSQKPFNFKVIRGETYIDHRDISTQVSLVEYKITEDAENGTDYMIEVELKEYVKFETIKEILMDEDGNRLSITETVERDEPVYEETIYQVIGDGYYVVQEGDTFQIISQKVFGHMNYAEAIAELNEKEYTLEVLPYVGLILNVNEESLKPLAEEIEAEKVEKQKGDMSKYEEIPGMGYVVDKVGVAGSINNGEGFWHTHFPWLFG